MKFTFARGRKYPLKITPRDLEIFRFLQVEEGKTSTELAQRFWNDKSKKTHAGFQRIRKLIEAEFLERGNPKLLYLSEHAKELLHKNREAQGVAGVK